MHRIIYTILLSGCTTFSVFRDRSSVAEGIASPAGFSKEYIKAGNFTLLTYQRFTRSSDKIDIYIEGDGRAWESKYKLSYDPTPSNPVALRLAAADPADNIAYIARPGQYSFSGLPDCDPQYWSNRRFSPEVVESIDKAIDIIKQKSGAQYLELVGFSGGGAIAVLVAAKRRDVRALRTVAGNLNTAAFCSYHHVSQLEGSINPLDVALKVAHIPQRHFVGSKDRIVPLAIAESFVQMEQDNGAKRITVVDGISHNGDWQRRWRDLLEIQPL